MLPYFATLVEHLGRGDAAFRESFGQHVHWGYWERPTAGPASPAEFHRAAEHLLERMVEQAAIRDGMAVLDVGCGFGGTINYLERRYRGCTLVGIDLGADQLRIAAASSLGGRGRNRVHFAQVDARLLAFPAATFDVIFCVESIFHFADRRSFFRECQRTLKPDGRLVISDFVPIRHLGRLLHYAERKTRLVGQMFGEFNSDISLPRYRRLAQSSGLELTSIDDITANTLPTYRFLRSNLHRIERRRRAYWLATVLVELVSRTRLVRYLILAFRKPDGQ